MNLRTKIKELLIQHKIIGILLAVAVVSLGFNVFKFPYFEGDEGIYVSRAVAFIQEGKFSTGTYWYDHPPLGWVIIGFWLNLTKSVSVESLLNSGRLLILVLNLANVFFLYKITYKLTGNKYLGMLTGLIFALSPLQMYFGRRILLDNIMSFLIISSVYSCLSIKKWQISVLTSAVFFALAVLTKENAVLFALPLLLMQLWLPKEGVNFKKSILLWSIAAFVIMSLYPIYALSRGELFPTGYFETGGKPSLVSTLIYQANRDSSNVFDFVKNPFWKHIKLWIEEDPVIIGLGTTAVLINLILGTKRKNRTAILLAVFVLVQVLFLIRGGVVMEFYILPLIPLIALNIAYAINFYSENYKTDLKIILPIVILLVTTGLFIKSRAPFFNNQTSAQIQAIDWINANKKDNTVIVSDSYAKADLYGKENIEIKSHFDAEYDDGFEEKIKSGKQNVDYLIYTKQVEWDLDNLDFVRSLLKDAKLLQEFKSDGWDIKIYGPSLKP